MTDAQQADAGVPPEDRPTEAAPGVTVAEANDPERLRGLIANLPGIESVGLELDEVVVHVKREGFEALMRTLRDDPQLQFQQLMDIAGVDWPDRAERFDVVYNLLSVTKNWRVRVIVRTNETEPVASVWTLYPVATWFEREAWDLFGIRFSGQPDLRRILTDYGFNGFPLRKDFPLTGYVEVRWDEERKQVVNEPVSLTADFRNFDFLSPWEGIMTLPGDEKAMDARKARIKAATTPFGPTQGKAP